MLITVELWNSLCSHLDRIDVFSPNPTTIFSRLEVQVHAVSSKFGGFDSPVVLHGCIIATIILIICSCIVLCSVSSSDPALGCPGPSKHLQVLSSIILPANCAWPSDYGSLLRHSSCDLTKSITIYASDLMHNIYSGAVEFRDFNDLGDLFRGQAQGCGWLIILEYEKSWCISVAKWIIASQISCFDYKCPRPYEPPGILHTDSKCIQELGNAGSEPLQQRTSQVIDLDFVPYSHLEASVRDIQASLQPGMLITIHFTTLSPNISVLSKQFITSSVPFLPRKYLSNSSNRTSTPLMIPLHRFIEIISSGPAVTAIFSITNISGERTRSLQAVGKELVENRIIRTKCIKEWGLENWRQQQLMLSWEAGLFSAGHLLRWEVVLRN